MTPEIVTVGTAGNVTDELKSAMESGDVSAIKTAAANAKNGTSAAASADAAAAAQKAAQDAYAAALAQGMDTNSAMQAAQSAAQQAVSNLQSGRTERGTADRRAESGCRRFVGAECRHSGRTGRSSGGRRTVMKRSDMDMAAGVCRPHGEHEITNWKSFS